MLEQININHFRCFQHFKLDGFERINLFGGLNNAGKTALLEAIAMLNIDDNINSISVGRNIELNQKESLEALHYERDLSINPVIFSDSNYVIELNANKPHDYHKIKSFQDNSYPQAIKIKYISLHDRMNNNELVNLFSKLEKDNIENRIIKLVEQFDPDIEQIRTFGGDANCLYYKKKKQFKYIPINALGDAVNKLIRLAITIYSKEYKVILIDEIENGLHYTKQEDFWKMLFELALEFDIQVFANTHSLEMIKAYSSAVNRHDNISMFYRDWSDEMAYFEMYRHNKTNQVQTTKLTAEDLAYRLQQNISLRGE